jgi:hypothetical protein
VSQFIPAPVKEAWNQWRASRAAAKEESDDGRKRIEGDNWGVKEAQENYKMEASEFIRGAIPDLSPALLVCLRPLACRAAVARPRTIQP